MHTGSILKILQHHQAIFNFLMPKNQITYFFEGVPASTPDKLRDVAAIKCYLNLSKILPTNTCLYINIELTSFRLLPAQSRYVVYFSQSHYETPIHY